MLHPEVNLERNAIICYYLKQELHLLLFEVIPILRALFAFSSGALPKMELLRLQQLELRNVLLPQRLLEQFLYRFLRQVQRLRILGRLH